MQTAVSAAKSSLVTLTNIQYAHFLVGGLDSLNLSMAKAGAVFSLFPPENALGNYVKVVQRVPVKIVFDKDPNNADVLRIGMSCVPTIITKD